MDSAPKAEQVFTSIRTSDKRLIIMIQEVIQRGTEEEKRCYQTFHAAKANYDVAYDFHVNKRDELRTKVLDRESGNINCLGYYSNVLVDAEQRFREVGEAAILRWEL